MPAIVRLLATAILTLTVAAAPFAAPAALDVTATCKVTGEIASNDLDVTLVLKQDARPMPARTRTPGRERLATTRY